MELLLTNKIGRMKKLCILLLSGILAVPAMAQTGGNASFAPKAGDWQASLNLGSGQFFNEYNGMNYLLPTYGSTTLGLSSGNTTSQSADPGVYLNLDSSFNSNSIVNIASFQGAYFLTNKLQINAFFSMDMNITPKKDYLESTYSYEQELEDGSGSQDDPLNLPSYKYIEGRVSSKWMAAIGGNYYFTTKNERVNAYLGALVGFQMGRVETVRPYTGETVYDPTIGESGPVELYYPSQKGGSIYGFRGSMVAGVEYNVSAGLLLGFEVQPVSYCYTLIRIQPQGMASYDASHHNIKGFAFPMLKLGIRF